MATYAELREKYVNGKSKEQKAQTRKAPDNAQIVAGARQYLAQHQAENAGKWAAWQEAATARDNASAAARAAEEAKKKYDEYLLTDEAQSYVRQNQAAKGAQMLQGAGISTPYASGMQQQAAPQKDQKAEALKAERDRLKNMMNAENDRYVMESDLAELATWTEEDRSNLDKYVGFRQTGITSGGYAVPAKEAYNNLVAKYGKEKVDQLAYTWQRDKNAKDTKALAERSAAAVKGNTGKAIGHSAATIPANLLGSVAGAYGVALDWATRDNRYSTLDPNNIGTMASVYSGAVRGQVAEDISGDEYDENGALIKDGGVIRQGLSIGYQGAMSAADSIARAAAGGGGFGTLALAATGSFSQTVSEASKQGATPQQAIILGIGNAALEAATEKVPLDNMLKAAKGGIKGAKAIAKEALRQAAIEATEEEISLFGSLLLEAAVLQEKSAYQQSIAEGIANGMTYEEAKEQADKAVWAEALNTAMVSAVAGGLSGGGSAIVGNVFNGSEEAAQKPVEAATQQKETQTQERPDVAQAVVQGLTQAQEADAQAKAEQDQAVANTAQSVAEQFPDRTQTAPKSQQQEQIDNATAAMLAENGVVQPEAEQNVGIKGTGAAEQNFTGTAAYDAMLSDDNVQPPRARDVRNVEVPIKDAKGKNVSQFVSNSMNAKVTPDTFTDTIKKMVIEGKGSYETVSDEASLRMAAEEIERDGGILESTRKVREAAESGKVGNSDIAKAQLLYQHLVNDKNQVSEEMAADVWVSMKEMATISGRNLHLFSLLQKMTPEGRLMTVEKNIDRYVDSINKVRTTKKKVDLNQQTETIMKDVEATVSEARQSAQEKAQKVASKVKYKNGKVVVKGNQSGEPFVFEYAEKVGNALAKGLENSRKPVKQTTFLQDITSELKKFAAEKMPPSEKRKTLTATELLRDYIQNQEFYADAWSHAQNVLREKYADDPYFQEFINSGIGVDANANPQNKILTKALVAAAAETGETTDVLRRQQALGVTNMSENIANKLIADTGATGEMAQTIKDAAREYVAEQTQKADEKENAKDYNPEYFVKEAMRSIHETMSNAVKQGNAGKAAIKEKVVAALVKKYGFGQADASHVADVVETQMQSMIEAQAKKILEQKLKPKTPSEQKTAQQIFNEYANLGAFDPMSAYSEQATAKVIGNKYNTTINSDLAEKFLNAKTETEQAEAMDAIYKDIAARIKPTIGEMWDAWRNLAMLGNIKTHGRNIGSTGAFQPYGEVKRDIAAAMEYLFVKKENRTKAVLGLGKNDRGLISWASKDAENAIDAFKMTGRAQNEARNRIEEHRKILPGILDTIAKKNIELMEKEDMVFKRSEYAKTMASFLKAKGYTVEQVQSGQVPVSVLNDGRQHAIQEALKATFNDRNKFSDAAAKLRVKGDSNWAKALNVVAKGVVPYTRTPANVVVRVAEYSPAGIAKGIDTLMRKVKSGEATVSDGLDQIAAGCTGTLVWGIGAAMAAGVIPGVRLIGRIDEEDDYPEEAIENSIQVGDKYYAIGWLSPAAVPLLIGANLYNNWKRLEKTGGVDDAWDIVDVCMNTFADVIDPILELSMLSSLKDVTDAYSAEDTPGQGFLSVLTTAATSYFTQGIPTIIGQLEQTLETEKTSTYVNTENRTEARIKKIVSNATQKIPGVDLYRTQKLDRWGSPVEVEKNTAIRAANAFLNPFTTATASNDSVDIELERLNKAQKLVNVNPPEVSKTISYQSNDGKTHDKHRLTEEQYQKLAQTQGQTAKKILDQMVTSSDYKKLTDDQKAYAIKAAYEYAQEQGKKAALPDYHSKAAEWISETKESDIQAFVTRGATQALNSAISSAVSNLGDGLPVTEATKADMEETYKAFANMSAKTKEQILDEASAETVKYLTARQNGATAKNYLDVVQNVKALGEKPKDAQTYNAVVNTPGMTDAVKDALVKAYMTDYDPDAKSPDKTELKYDYIRQKMEMSPQEYAQVYSIYDDIYGKKLEEVKKLGYKDKKSAYLDEWVKMGFSSAQANELYNLLVNTSKNTRIDVVSWYENQ